MLRIVMMAWASATPAAMAAVWLATTWLLYKALTAVEAFDHIMVGSSRTVLAAAAMPDRSAGSSVEMGRLGESGVSEGFCAARMTLTVFHCARCVAATARLRFWVWCDWEARVCDEIEFYGVSDIGHRPLYGVPAAPSQSHGPADPAMIRPTPPHRPTTRAQHYLQTR